MAYLDDFGWTSSAEKARLLERCEREWCGHPRYLHGTTREVREGWRYIEHTEGKCNNCRCSEFTSEKSITKDEVLDLHDGLAKIQRLVDLGISRLDCHVVITRFTDEGPKDMPCVLASGHEGAHDAGG